MNVKLDPHMIKGPSGVLERAQASEGLEGLALASLTSCKAGPLGLHGTLCMGLDDPHSSL